MTDPGSIAALLTGIAATGLPGAPGKGLSAEIDAAEWPSLRGGLLGHRLTGLAVEAASRGQLLLPDQPLAELLKLQRDAMAMTLVLESRLVELSARLRADDIDFLVLKGPAVAHGYYTDPAWRPFSDLDLLVRQSQWNQTASLLNGMGFARNLPEPRPNFDIRFGKAVTWIRGEVAIDLHRSLAAGPFGLWMVPDELWEHTESFELGGQLLERLDVTGQLLHACVHASLGWFPPLILPLRDVLQIASESSVDWEELSSWSRRWRLNGVLQHALTTAATRFGTSLPGASDTLLHAPVGTRERRALEAYTTQKRHRGGTAVAALAAIPGLRARATYAHSLLWPDREFLKARSSDGESSSYLRRWATPARWFLGDRRGQ